MSPKELKALIKVMRANGVLSLKSNGVEINLTHESLFPGQKKVKAMKADTQNEIVDNTPAWMKYSPEQLATWSAPNEEATEEIGVI